MNDIARIYRAEILRAVLGGNPPPAKAHDLTRLNKIAEHLAECEEAQTILRAKGHGCAGMSFVDVARNVDERQADPARHLQVEAGADGRCARHLRGA